MCWINSLYVFWRFECFLLLFELVNTTRFHLLYFWFGFLSCSVLYPIWGFSWFLFGRALLNSLLRKVFASLLLVYGKLKNKSFVITFNFLQCNKKFISKFGLLALIDNFSSFLGLLIGSTLSYLFEML